MDWKTIDSAPWGKPVWVKNDLMEYPVKATRGAVCKVTGAVLEDRSLFTSVYTPDPNGFFPTPAGLFICPTHWAPIEGNAT